MNKLDKVLQADAIWNWYDLEMLRKEVKSADMANYIDRVGYIRKYARIINTYLPEYVGDISRDILDIGCNNGVLIELMRTLEHRVKGIEKTKSPFMPFYKQSRISVDCIDVQKMPFSYKDNTFHVVTSIGVITEWYKPADWEKFLNELFRIARRTIVLGVKYNTIYKENKAIIDDFKLPKKWDLVVHNGSFYKWSCAE